jgi:hypothetical protein
VADLAEPMPPPQTGIIDLSGGSPATGPVMLSPDPPIPEELQPFAPGSKFAPEPGPAQPFPNLTQPAAPPVEEAPATLLGLQMPPMAGSTRLDPVRMSAAVNEDPTGLIAVSNWVSNVMTPQDGEVSTLVDDGVARYWRLHLACPTPVQFNPYYLPVGSTAPTEVVARQRFWDDNGLGGSMHELSCIKVDYIPDSHSDKVGK